MEDDKTFITETDAHRRRAEPDKHVQFLDSPKPPRPNAASKHLDKYVAPASSASQTTTKLLQKRRKNAEWQQHLEAKREEFAKRMAECDERQTQLKKKCKELRKRVQTKEQEVQETRTKIERATKKQEEEKLFQQQKDKEIDEKKELVQKGDMEHAELKQKLDNRNQYKAYLDRVCEEHEGTGLGFDEVDSILMKHESFLWTTSWLREKREGHVDEIEELKDKLSKYSKISVTQVVEKNAKISERRSLLDELRNQTRDQAGEDEKRKGVEQKRIKELGEIEMAVDNLYNRCFLQGKQTKASIQEAERLSKLTDEAKKIIEMLSRLCTFFIDMREISKEAKHHPRPAEPVAHAQHGRPTKRSDDQPRTQQTSNGQLDSNSLQERMSISSQEKTQRRSSRANTLSTNQQVLSISKDPLA
eukprot:TRINITY_DN11559_c0_g1_i4.p1 TRINITY_DN11559_c0_g1~~TRINITY_DN11559_c0_g1_i4.p1  ORF type:complete len:417 (+),score=153.51 TRINITY_DN11559_c0_g1_i4:237-1487(+)